LWGEYDSTYSPLFNNKNMALELSLTKNITDYSVLTLVDNTGAYDAGTNPTGWGAPNMALADVDYAVLTITAPDATVYTVDILADLGITYATDDLIFNVTADLLGGTLGDTLADGIWTVLYQVSDDAGVTTTDLTVAVCTYYQVQVLVFDHIALIPGFYSCQKCCSLQLKDVVIQFMLLQALIYASEYAYITEFTNILTTLQQITSFDLDLICNC